MFLPLSPVATAQYAETVPSRSMPDNADMMPGGRMGKGTPNTDVDWAILRASQTPGPGQYILPSSVLEARGGVICQARGKTDADWQCLRTSKQPAPHDYDVNASWGCIDTSRYRGGIMLGRNSGPAKMPFPYTQFSSDSCDGYRGDPSADHENAKCPWKDNEAWSKVARPKNAHSLGANETSVRPDISDPLSPSPESPDHGNSAQDKPNELMNDYEEQGRAGVQQLSVPRQQNAREPPANRAGRETSQHITAPWRDPTNWSKVAKRPTSGGASRSWSKQAVATLSQTSVRPASAGFCRSVESTKPRAKQSGDHTKALAPWRDQTWRKVTKDPAINPVFVEEPLPDRSAIETPWRVESWIGSTRKAKKRPSGAAALAPLDGATARGAAKDPALAATEEAGRQEKLRELQLLRTQLAAVKRSLGH